MSCEWINEPELCQQLQISRTPLREALKVLATEGMVELVPRRGAHVAQLSTRELVDLFEALSGIEGLAAQLAAVRMSVGDLEKLSQLQILIEQRHEARDRHAYFHDNQELHKADRPAVGELGDCRNSREANRTGAARPLPGHPLRGALE
jgi:DNA-binding GntR family transcriptional regulator